MIEILELDESTIECRCKHCCAKLAIHKHDVTYRNVLTPYLDMDEKDYYYCPACGNTNDLIKISHTDFGRKEYREEFVKGFYDWYFGEKDENAQV